MEKITREHGDLFLNPTALPEFGVVYHYAAWSYAAHYWLPVVRAMDAYPDIPLYVIDLGAPAYATFSAASGVTANGKGEVLFVRGGHVLNCYTIGRSREGIQQRVKKELHMLERCRDPEELLFQRIVYLLETMHGKGDPPDTPATRIEADRGCTGDDAYDLMVAYAETFKVDVSDFQYHDYFHGEGFNPISEVEALFKWVAGRFKPLPNDKKELTIAHLMQGVQAGRLDEEVIWGAQAKTDLNHPMHPPCE